MDGLREAVQERGEEGKGAGVPARKGAAGGNGHRGARPSRGKTLRGDAAASRGAGQFVVQVNEGFNEVRVVLPTRGAANFWIHALIFVLLLKVGVSEEGLGAWHGGGSSRLSCCANNENYRTFPFRTCLPT